MNGAEVVAPRRRASHEIVVHARRRDRRVGDTRRLTQREIAAQVRRVAAKFPALRHVAEDIVSNALERLARQRTGRAPLSLLVDRAALDWKKRAVVRLATSPDDQTADPVGAALDALATPAGSVELLDRHREVRLSPAEAADALLTGCRVDLSGSSSEAQTIRRLWDGAGIPHVHRLVERPSESRAMLRRLARQLDMISNPGSRSSSRGGQCYQGAWWLVVDFSLSQRSPAPDEKPIEEGPGDGLFPSQYRGLNDDLGAIERVKNLLNNAAQWRREPRRSATVPWEKRRQRAFACGLRHHLDLSTLWIAVLFIAKDVGPAGANDAHGRYALKTMMDRVEKIIVRHHTPLYRDWIDRERQLLAEIRRRPPWTRSADRRSQADDREKP
jgi:hypothetical protein